MFKKTTRGITANSPIQAKQVATQLLIRQLSENKNKGFIQLTLNELSQNFVLAVFVAIDSLILLDMILLSSLANVFEMICLMSLVHANQVCLTNPTGKIKNDQFSKSVLRKILI